MVGGRIRSDTWTALCTAFGLAAAWGCAAGPRAIADAAGTTEASTDAGMDIAASRPAPRVAVETADESALLELAAWADLPTFRTGRYLHRASTDRETKSFPPQAQGNRDYNNYICAGIISGGVDPSIYLDSPTCPETYLKGFAGARFEGSGRLARLWATGIDLPGQNPIEDAIFRIYVDDEPEPVVEIAIGDAKRPPASLEIFAPPFGANTDNNLAWYYPVVFSRKLIVSIDNIPNTLVWYQASVVLDQQAATRVRAAERLPARDKAKVLLGSLAAPVPEALPLMPEATVQLPQETPVTVASLSGPATMHSLRIRVPDSAAASLNMVDIEVTWDADTTPAVAMPIGDLFASGAGLADTSSASLPLAITKSAGETTLDLRLPMPFATKATIVLNNHGANTAINLSIDGLPSLPTEPWGHLAAIRSETVGPTANPLHPIVAASGQGRLVGTCLMAKGHSSPLIPAFIRGPLNFLEGDERMSVDNEAFQGTGTEDYFDSAFYFNLAAAGFPFAQWGGKVENVSSNSGSVSACRWHVLGAAIDFQQSLDFSIEIGPPDPTSLDRYVTTAFLYRPR